MLMAEGSQANKSFELPAVPAPEHLEAAKQKQTAESQTAALESIGKAQESATGKQAPQIFPLAPATAADDQAAVAPALPATPVTGNDRIIAALPAKDGDLIEKEWVDRAKHIISQTADDPHKQKHEVSKIKAAYVQKRFNKAIKIDEAPA